MTDRDHERHYKMSDARADSGIQESHQVGNRQRHRSMVDIIQNYIAELPSHDAKHHKPSFIPFTIEMVKPFANCFEQSP